MTFLIICKKKKKPQTKQQQTVLSYISEQKMTHCQQRNLVAWYVFIDSVFNNCLKVIFKGYKSYMEPQS